MMQKIIKPVIFILGTLFISGCQADTDAIIQRMIDTRIEKRISEFISKEKERCLEKIMVEAAIAADSALRANPILILLDSLHRPPVPSKPQRPQLELPRDSIQIAPIVPQIEEQQ